MVEETVKRIDITKKQEPKVDPAVVEKQQLIEKFTKMLNDLYKVLETKDDKRNYRLLVRVAEDIIRTPKSNTLRHKILQKKADKYLKRIQAFKQDIKK